MGISQTFNLGMGDNNSQQDEGTTMGPAPVSFCVYRENSCRYVWTPLGIPTSYQEAAKRQPEQVLAQYRGRWLLEDAVLKGKAVSAVSELQRQKAVTRITPHVNRLCVYWKRCVLLRTWPWGLEQFCGPPGNNMHGLSATFMLQTYRT